MLIKNSRNTLDVAYRYADDISSGKIEACKWVKLAVKRFYDDLKEGDKRGLWFDEDRASQDLQFFDFLNIKRSIETVDKFDRPITKSVYDRFVLEPWQSFICANAYGWMKKSRRRFTDINICVSRKQGKSTLGSAVGVKGMIADREIESQVYCAGTTLNQAKIVFNEAKKMIRISPMVSELFGKDDILKESIFYQPTQGVFKPVTGDPSKLDGFNPQLAICDEAHEYRTNAMYDIFATGNGGRADPQIWIITTAGFHKDYWYYEHLQNNLQILEGKIEDDNSFVIYYTLDDENEIYDPTKWIKANPNLGVSVQENYFEKQVSRAKVSSTTRTQVWTKNFNLFVDASEQWIASEVWNKLNRPDVFEKDKVVKVWAGIDGARSRDIFSYSKFFELEGGDYFMKHHFYIAESQISRLNGAEKMLYEKWIADGWIEVTDGKTINHEYVERQIKADFEEFRDKFGFIGYDPYRIEESVKRLNEELPSEYVLDEAGKKYVAMERLQPVSQNLLNLADATRYMEDLLMNERLYHDGNPVMSWMMANVEMVFDSNQNYKPSRKNETKKIDGVMSTLDAIKLKIKFFEADEEESPVVFFGNK